MNVYIHQTNQTLSVSHMLTKFTCLNASNHKLSVQDTKDLIPMTKMTILILSKCYAKSV